MQSTSGRSLPQDPNFETFMPACFLEGNALISTRVRGFRSPMFFPMPPWSGYFELQAVRQSKSSSFFVCPFLV